MYRSSYEDFNPWLFIVNKVSFTSTDLAGCQVNMGIEGSEIPETE